MPFPLGPFSSHAGAVVPKPTCDLVPQLCKTPLRPCCPRCDGRPPSAARHTARSAVPADRSRASGPHRRSPRRGLRPRWFLRAWPLFLHPPFVNFIVRGAYKCVKVHLWVLTREETEPHVAGTRARKCSRTGVWKLPIPTPAPSLSPKSPPGGSFPRMPSPGPSHRGPSVAPHSPSRSWAVVLLAQRAPPPPCWPCGEPHSGAASAHGSVDGISQSALFGVSATLPGSRTHAWCLRTSVLLSVKWA